MQVETNCVVLLETLILVVVRKLSKDAPVEEDPYVEVCLALSVGLAELSVGSNVGSMVTAVAALVELLAVVAKVVVLLVMAVMVVVLEFSKVVVFTILEQFVAGTDVASAEDCSDVMAYSAAYVTPCPDTEALLE